MDQNKHLITHCCVSNTNAIFASVTSLSPFLELFTTVNTSQRLEGNEEKGIIQNTRTPADDGENTEYNHVRKRIVTS